MNDAAKNQMNATQESSFRFAVELAKYIQAFSHWAKRGNWKAAAETNFAASVALDSYFDQLGVAYKLRESARSPK